MRHSAKTVLTHGAITAVPLWRLPAHFAAAPAAVRRKINGKYEQFKSVD
jgi:hypothetical protein